MLVSVNFVKLIVAHSCQSWLLDPSIRYFPQELEDQLDAFNIVLFRRRAKIEVICALWYVTPYGVICCTTSVTRLCKKEVIHVCTSTGLRGVQKVICSTTSGTSDSLLQAFPSSNTQQRGLENVWTRQASST